MDVRSKQSLTERLIRTIGLGPHTPSPHRLRELIRRGADVNGTQGTLKPLHCACMVADPRCVKLLLDHGALVNARDGYERAPLHYAAERDPGCVAALLQGGADPAARDGGGDTPLHWASFRGRADCAGALLQRWGGGVGARDLGGDTPLCWAAARGHLHCARLLLEHGAHPRPPGLRAPGPVARLRAQLARGGAEDGEEGQECLRLLLRAGGGEEGEGEEEGERGPSPLRALARFAIRRSLGPRYLPPAINSLPLPPALKDDLLLLG